MSKDILYKIIILFLFSVLIKSFIKIYENKKIVVLTRKKKSVGGLLFHYYMYLGCISNYIFNGYIPIIDLSSYPNIFNGFNISKTTNPWEQFFNQPFGYSISNIKKKYKNIIYAECQCEKNSPKFNIFYNNIIREYWHKLANKYIPVKSEIIREANDKFKFLFNNLINVLGILIRGTDYIAKKPRGHAIQPNPEMVFKDIKNMDKKFNYDWIFITTEDDFIREKFKKKFGKRLKYIKSKININYDYRKKQFLAFNSLISGNVYYMRIYLINVIILSKCLDIICSKTAGSLVTFILTNGFRNIKVYNLGYYK